MSHKRATAPSTTKLYIKMAFDSTQAMMPSVWKAKLINGSLVFTELRPAYDSCPPKPRSRRVRFAEEKNEQHPNSLSFEEIRTAWYNHQDYIRFNQETSELAAQLLTKELASDDPHSWSRSLFRAYQAFQIAHTPDQVKPVLEANPVEMNVDTVGMESMVMRAVGRDYQSRRRQLLQEVRYAQIAFIPNESNREELIRAAVRRNGRVSRLFARYVAHVSTKIE